MRKPMKDIIIAETSVYLRINGHKRTRHFGNCIFMKTTKYIPVVCFSAKTWQKYLFLKNATVIYPIKLLAPWSCDLLFSIYHLFLPPLLHLLVSLTSVFLLSRLLGCSCHLKMISVVWVDLLLCFPSNLRKEKYLRCKEATSINVTFTSIDSLFIQCYRICI